ncbi:MAG: CDP-alcohol phosphatidyltransferase family protein [Candidatus Melainabacteria bacterium]
MPQYSVQDIRRLGYKSRNSWWGYFFLHPVATRVLWVIANYTSLRPEVVCVMGLLIGFVAVPFFMLGTRDALLVGALIAFVSNLFDAMDGKLARLKNQVTPFGGYLDSLSDVLKHTAYLLALSAGQATQQNNPVWLMVGCGLSILFALKYTNENMLGRIRAFLPVPEAQAGSGGSEQPRKAASGLMAWFDAFDARCARMSLRPAPCGVECITLMFIVGPLMNQVMPCLILGGACVLLYALAHTAMTFQKTRCLTRGLQKDALERQKVCQLVGG